MKRVHTLRGQKIAASRIGVTLEEYQREITNGKSWCSYHESFEPDDLFRTNENGFNLSTYCKPAQSEYHKERNFVRIVGRDYGSQLRKILKKQ